MCPSLAKLCAFNNIGPVSLATDNEHEDELLFPVKGLGKALDGLWNVQALNSLCMLLCSLFHFSQLVGLELPLHRMLKDCAAPR